MREKTKKHLHFVKEWSILFSNIKILNMKKYLLLFVQLTFLSFYTFGQNQPTVAPLNPAYIEYLNNLDKSKDNLRTEEGFYLGEIPLPFELNFDNTYYPITKSIPASYDLRTIDGGAYLTPVKNQGNSGTCWAFTAYAALESYWKKIGLPAYDLSEKNLATCDGFNRAPNQGGNYLIPTAYLMRGSGPITEADDPYNLPANAYCISGLTPVAYVDQMRNLPGISSGSFDPDFVKQAVMDYGALYVNMRWDGNYYSSANYTFFYDGTANPNHAVALVGWDDNKVVTGGSAATPSGDGAWIIKNSWGENWGEAGYFYISYEDTKTLTSIAFFPSFINFKHNAEIHSYDNLGSNNSLGYGDGDDYALIKFTASRDQQIEKIGTYATASNTTLSFDIYSSFDGSSLSVLLGSLHNQICAIPGYYTFDLTTPVPINAGNDFYVRVRYQSADEYPIPFESNIGGIYNNVVIESGKCWVSNHGSSWMAIGGGTSHPYDLCIKAYGAFTGCLPPEASTVSSYKYIAEIEWESSESEFEMEYGIAPYSFSGNANKENINDTTCLLTSLKHSTPYEYKIRSVCGGQSSEWSTTRTFSTSCESITVFPYIENFNTSHLCPSCWEISDNLGWGQVWAIGQKTDGLDGTTGNYAYLDSDTYGEHWGQNSDLISTTFDFSGYTDVILAFKHYYRHYASSASLFYSTNNGSSWTQIQQWTATTANPATFSQTIPALANQSQVKFKWNYTGAWDWYWFVDDIQVTATASGSLTVSNQTQNLSSNMAYQHVTVEHDGDLTIEEDVILTVTGDLLVKSDKNGTGSFIDLGIVNVSGTSTVEKFIDADHTFGTTVTAPVIEAGNDIFSGHSNTYYFNPFDGTWTPYSSGTMETMRGYWTKFDSDKTLIFNEIFNTGDYTYTDFYRTNVDAGTGNFGWNFIGNPYPSGLDWDDVVAENGGASNFTTNTKLNNAIYMAKADGGYYHYNGVGTGFPAFDGIIPPATAFWIQVNKDYFDSHNPNDPVTGAHLKLSNTSRKHLSQGLKEKQNNNLLRIYLSNDTYTDDIVLRWHPDATFDFDKAYDAYKMTANNNAIPQLYMLTDNDDKLAIYTIPEYFSETTSIPIAYRNEHGNELNMSFENIFSLSDDIALYLEDKQENIIQDLRKNNNYTFTPNIQQDEDRFLLHLVLNQTELDNNLVNKQPIIYAAESALYINTLATKSYMAIYNIVGQEIFQLSLSGEGLHKINLEVATGAYVVSLIDDIGGMAKKKIFIE